MIKRFLRPLYGKIDTKKLDSDEWDLIAEVVTEYANNSMIIGIVIGVMAVLFIAFLIGIFC